MREPEWKPAASWLWLPVVGLVAGYLVVLLTVWCLDGIDNVGRDDPLVPWLYGLVAAPMVAFGLTYAVALRGWRHRRGRILVAAVVTAMVALLALAVRAAMAGGM
jgi:hypothetical protein